MVVYFPIYIPLFLLLPTYHKYGGSYSYRKLFRRKKISADRIDRIKNAERSPVYKIYIKREIFPLLIVYKKIKGGVFTDIPYFAKEIMEKFPPEDYPPPKKE
jgi:hypothetical protein